MDWVCLVLDAHFTVLVMTPEAKGLLLNLHNYVKSQVIVSPSEQVACWFDNNHYLGNKWKPENKTICCLVSPGETGVWAWKDRKQPPSAPSDESEERRWTILHWSHWALLEYVQNAFNKPLGILSPSNVLPEGAFRVVCMSWLVLYVLFGTDEGHQNSSWVNYTVKVLN